MGAEKMCPCGKRLHYNNPRTQELVEAEIERLGGWMDLRFLAGQRVRVFRVPRHWVALHGTNLDDIVGMKFEEVPPARLLSEVYARPAKATSAAK